MQFDHFLVCLSIFLFPIFVALGTVLGFWASHLDLLPLHFSFGNMLLDKDVCHVGVLPR